MDSDSIKDLEIAAHVLTIARTHGISVKEAVQLYIQRVKWEKWEAEQQKQSDTSLSDSLKERLSPQKWKALMSYVRHHPSNEQLTQAYYQAKQEGKLKLAKLLVPKIFYLRNSDFVGKKYCEAGAIVEAEEYENVICHIWLSPVECEFIFPNEVEFI
ncbi:hypothetical protein [Nostoc sp. CALU 546]|uniref:hypothetical protein n=1 Tax=Nostoc sp. CALU 546 TaxID=1867241 RepID=UPI003B66B39E